MKITILTIFPEMFAPLHLSMLGRAEKAGLLDICEVNIRDYSKNKHHNTDDAPFGGGAGMVMLAQPIVDAIRDVQGEHFKGRRIYLSPRGKTLTQAKVEELATDCFCLSGGYYDSCVWHCYSDTSSYLSECIIVNAIVKVIGIDVVGTLETWNTDSVWTYAVYGFEMLRVHQKSCEFVFVQFKSE